MFGFDPDFFIPIMIFAIPIIAIVGGITIAIVRSLGRQRLIELAQQERIAAIQRGVDLSKLPPMLAIHEDDDYVGMGPAGVDRDRRRSQGLLIGGIVVLASGIGISLFLRIIDEGDRVWAVGIIPIAVGTALLLSSWIVAPKGRVDGPRS